MLIKFKNVYRIFPYNSIFTDSLPIMLQISNQFFVFKRLFLLDTTFALIFIIAFKNSYKIDFTLSII